MPVIDAVVEVAQAVVPEVQVIAPVLPHVPLVHVPVADVDQQVGQVVCFEHVPRLVPVLDRSRVSTSAEIMKQTLQILGSFILA